MQVKKFEAKTMKEALELVKTNLGPDAIILSVRDNSTNYGLVGEGSVEVTAAVAEHTLRKKQFVESRLNAKDKERFQKSPARTQKEFIDKLVRQHSEIRQQKPVETRQITATPYIQIADEERTREAASLKRVSDMLSSLPEEKNRRPTPETAYQRIRSAARDAWQAGQVTVGANAQASPAPVAAPAAPESDQILALRQEISQLKSVIQEFHKVPQKFVSVHPGAEAGIPFDLSFMYEKLANAGINGENMTEILFQAQTEIPVLHIKKKAMVDAWVAKYLLNHIQVDEAPFGSLVHTFVGPGGQGKTATLVKMASHFVVTLRKRIAILTADSFKVGAVDQLRIYAQILNVPFVVLRAPMEWSSVLKQLGAVDHILIDFPGMQLRDSREIDFVNHLLPSSDLNRKTHLVLSANLKDSDASETGRRYQSLGFSDVIFTDLDESVHHGVIYNFQKQFSKPLHSFGIGPRIPEDFEEATRERVLDLIFKLSKIKKEAR